MAEKRARSYFLQRNYYFETHDKLGNLISGETEEQWKKRVTKEIKNIGGVKSVAFIFHNKDIDKDGSPKGLHVHILITFVSAKTPSAVQKITGTSSFENTQRVKNKVQSARYLTHISEDAINKDKHRYDKSEVICVNCNYEDMVVATGHKNPDATAFVNDLSYKLQHYQLTMKQAKKLILEAFEEDGQTVWRKYRDSLKKDFAEGLEWESDKIKQTDRDFHTIYFCGAGGVGKSQLAKAIALTLGNGSYHSAAVGSRDKTFDFIGNYQGEKVSVLNELSPSAFSAHEFFDDFDRHQFAEISSRNVDKPWLAKYALVTYTSRLTSWIHDLLRFTKGSTARYGQAVVESGFDNSYREISSYETDFWQGLRRFTGEVLVEKVGLFGATATVLFVNEKTHQLELYSQRYCSDVRSDGFCKKWARKVICDLVPKAVKVNNDELDKMDDERQKFLQDGKSAYQVYLDGRSEIEKEADKLFADS